MISNGLPSIKTVVNKTINPKKVNKHHRILVYIYGKHRICNYYKYLDGIDQVYVNCAHSKNTHKQRQ